MENGDIPDANVIASRERSNYTDQFNLTRLAKDGRLNGMSFWASGDTNNDPPWIQADLGNTNHPKLGS